MNRFSDKSLGYALAVFVAIAALYLRFLLTPVLGGNNPYHTVWLAVVFCSWYCGLGPSIVCSLVCALGVDYLFLTPYHSLFFIQDRTQLYGMLGFLLFSSAIIALGESNRRGAASRSLLASVVDSSDDAIISKNLNGIITSWNHGAERLFGWTSKETIGQPITIIIPPELRDEETTILKRISAGERIDHLETTRRNKTGDTVIVALTISPVKNRNGRIVGASKIARDISERKLVEARLKAVQDDLEKRVRERTAEFQEKHEELMKQSQIVRDLSARLLQSQDAERRRIARELHDSVGQLLAAISMNISKVAREKEKLSSQAERCVEENQKLVEQIQSEIRTLSHLLHPPLLDEIGLESAIRWFIDGFTQRSKIDVSLDMPSGLDRMTSESELAIFRIVQESLTNIHRHSGSLTARIQLAKEDGCLHCKISDDGRGIPLEKQLELNSYGVMGVGISGMRERIRQLGGTVQIESNGRGTTVAVTLPFSRAQESAAANS
ncbi:MAG TPA: PAS domain S-box protein [Candidatus Acidoferrum sp.]|nr:PAS domain S-box protein [Candidatus Acidoferrum sp.]